MALAAEPRAKRSDLATFAKLGLAFWRAEQRWLAWALTAAIVALSICALLFQLRLNAWNRDFFDAIERRNWAEVTAQLTTFVLVLAFGVGVAVSFVLARMTLQIRWRKWLTERLVRAWMRRGRAYQLDIAAAHVANPEYRIANDARLTTELFVEFVVGFLSAALMAVAFAGVLMGSAGSANFTILGVAVTVPAYMVLAAVGYSAAATTLMFLVGSRLVPLTESKNQKEAEFLFALTRARESAEPIALASGERAVRRRLSGSLDLVVREWFAIMRRQTVVTGVASGNGVLLSIVPLLLLAPKYLASEITLGQMIQLAAAFGFVVASLNWFFDNFQRFAEWSASVNRVALLVGATERLRTEEAGGAGRIVIELSDTPGLRLSELSATFEDGRAVVSDADVTIAAGERVLLLGETGVGKSTLVKAIAGIWPWGSGKVTAPRDARIVVVPQAPFLPAGRLIEAVTWPAEPERTPRAEIEELLRAVGLGSLVERLDAEDRWDQVLAEGDQERLAFARAILRRPDILILDQATSALDEASEAQLYGLLAARFPKLTLLSVGHRESLERHHDRKLTLVVDREGGARMSEARIDHRSASPPGRLKRLFDKIAATVATPGVARGS
jgi:putative ATP-binding cassette transporter